MNEEKAHSFIASLRHYHRNFEGSDFALLEKHQSDLLMAAYPMLLMAFSLGFLFSTVDEVVVLALSALSACAIAFMVLRRASLCFQAKDLLLRKRVFDLS